MDNPAEQFFTRAVSNEGTELPLYTPDGKKSEHKLWIRGVDSDAFRKALHLQKRRYMELAAEHGSKAVDKINEQEDQLDLLSSLVIKWTFPQECTLENVKNFLREAPQIADSINTYSGRRSLFFKRSLNSSLSTQEPNLS